MREEYELEVLEKYDLEVRSTRKIRGAFFCDTNEGTMLFGETKMSERHALFLYQVLSRLETSGNIKVDTPVCTKEGGDPRRCGRRAQIYAQKMVLRKRMRCPAGGGSRARGRAACSAS